MNKQYPRLPSISTLLTGPPPPMMIMMDKTLPETVVVSPLLSPVDSYASSSPPPPSSLHSPTLTSSSSHDLSLPKKSQPHPHAWPTLLPRPPKRVREQQSIEDDPYPPLPPMTQIILSESGEPILKRRRGRPPIMTEGNRICTFLTPTVWDVKHHHISPLLQTSSSSHHVNSKRNNNNTMIMTFKTAAATAAATTTTTTTTTSSPHSNLKIEASTTPPLKKRGRKSKHQMKGNSCFSWKDLATT
ncbi:uncharacterized protein BX663DRAFT_522857, partial [Cokeromyces recurvatus]|uniref:uncharacterized protein n=1 Tax=Cokeromyces recurvatus TaxID=90255 RepID=UPI00221F0F51